MAILFTKQHAMRDLPFIEDRSLYQSIDLALWLYLDQRCGFRYAVNVAAKKYNHKPKSAIEKLMREVIPEEVLLERMAENQRNNGYKAKDQVTHQAKNAAVGAQRVKRMVREGARHINDITARG